MTNPEIIVSYEDLSDVWNNISDAVKGQLPLRQVTLTNKLGATTSVESIPIKLISSFDPVIQKIHEYENSAVSWFRQPAVSLVLISCDDAESYKRNFRLQLRAMIDSETRHPLSPEPVFIYVSPRPSPDIDPKGGARVIDAMRRELGSRHRERIVRIDPGYDNNGRIKSLEGISELIECLKHAIAASLETRMQSYSEVLRHQLAALQSGSSHVNFLDFFLVKDSLAAMMEAMGLLDDALREYLELEVAFQQVEHQQRRNTTNNQNNTIYHSISSNGEDKDESHGMWADWGSNRRCVVAACSLPTTESISHHQRQQEQKKEGVDEEDDDGRTPIEKTDGDVISGHYLAPVVVTSVFAIRQALFSSQSRVLLKLGRYGEVLERGFSFLLQYCDGFDQQLKPSCPKFYKESWTFAAALSLASAVPPAVSSSSPFSSSLNGNKSSNEESNPFNSIDNSIDWKVSSDLPSSVVSTDKSNALEAPLQAATPSYSADLKSMHAIMGQLYRIAREQLITLGKSRGLQEPTFVVASLKECLAQLELAEDKTSSTKPSRGGSGIRSMVLEDAVSPRRASLGGLKNSTRRSVSPNNSNNNNNNRASLDAAGSLRGSISYHTSGVIEEMIDHGLKSFSVGPMDHVNNSLKIQTGQEKVGLASSPFGEASGTGNDDAMMAMQNVDLTMSSSSIQLMSSSGNSNTSELGLEENNRQLRLGPMGAAAIATTDVSNPTEANNNNNSNTSIHNTLEIGPAVSTVTSIALPHMHHSTSGSVASTSTTPPGTPPLGPSAPDSLPNSNILPSITTATTTTMTTTATSLSAPSSELSAVIKTVQQEVISGSNTASRTIRMHEIERILDELCTDYGRQLSSSPRTDNRSSDRPSKNIRNTQSDPHAATWSPVHWRLRTALASQEAYADLLQTLSGAAATCFELSGRHRQAILCRTEIADSFATVGKLEEALAMYESECRIALNEGWMEIAETLLPKLTYCQAKRNSAGLAHTAAAIVTLAIARQAQNTTANAASLKASNLLKYGVELLCHACARASAVLPLPPPLLPSPAIEFTNCIDLTPVLVAEPMKGRFGRFYRRNDPVSGKPILHPTSTGNLEELQGKGPMVCAVGDVVPIMLVLTNTLPTALPLHDIRLLLVGMQEITALASPSAISPAQRYNVMGWDVRSGALDNKGALQNMPLSSPYSSLHHAGSFNNNESFMSLKTAAPHQSTTPLSTASTGMHAPSTVHHHQLRHGKTGTTSAVSSFHVHKQPPPPSSSSQYGGGGASSPYFRADSFTDEVGIMGHSLAMVGGGSGGSRFLTQWQDNEDLICSLVDLIPLNNSNDSGTKNIKEQGGSLQPASLLTPKPAQITMLHPGVNHLIFMAAPLKRGLYKPAYISALLHNVEVRLEVSTNVSSMTIDNPLLPPVSTTPSASTSDPWNEQHIGRVNYSSSRGWHRQQDVGSTDTSMTPIPCDNIVLQVEPTVARISVDVLSAGLVAGQAQWLGISISSVSGDEGIGLQHGASLSLTWSIPSSSSRHHLRNNSTGNVSMRTNTVARAAVRKATTITATTPSDSVLHTTVAPQPSLAPCPFLPVDASHTSTSTSTSASLADYDHNTGTVTVNALIDDAEPCKRPEPVPSTMLDDGSVDVIFPHRSNDSTESIKSTTLWWWVDASECIDGEPEVVKVLTPGQHHPSSLSLQPSYHPFQEQLPTPGIPVTNNSMHHHHNININNNTAVVPSNVAVAAVLPLPVCFQYTAGCRRSYSKVLSLPISYPFSIKTIAKELPRSHFVVCQFTVTSLLPFSCLLTSATLALQPGLKLVQDMGADMSVLPITVPSHGVVSLSYKVEIDKAMAAGDRAAAQARLQQAAKNQPTALQLNYTVNAHDTSGIQLTTEGSKHVVSLPSVEDMHRVVGNQHKQVAQQECTFTHRCAFELSPLESDLPGAVVLIQLLGPFSAPVGLPISLCWRLERADTSSSIQSSSSFVSEQPQEQQTNQLQIRDNPLAIQFEIVADNELWRPMGKRTGTVTLEAYDGALATIEACFIPLNVGALPAPTLRLADCSYQECFDVGSNGVNFIIVTPTVA